MPDEPDQTDAPENDSEPDEGLDLERAKAKITKANNEARSLRERLKVAEEKAARLDELEDSGKSEIEKLTAKVAESEQRAQEAERRALVAEVAQEKGLTPAQAKRLVGSSMEELQADADELLTSFKPQEGTGGGKPPEGKPTPDLRGGGDPTTEPPLDVAALVDSIPPTA